MIEAARNLQQLYTWDSADKMTHPAGALHFGNAVSLAAIHKYDCVMIGPVNMSSSS